MGDDRGIFGRLFGRRAQRDAGDELVQQMLAGVVAQVQREQDVDALRGTEPMVVRVAPQLPIRDHAAPRSWLGGGAALPEGVPWPQVDGQRAMVLAHLCCHDLPAALWDGLGPREGWLCVFMHPSTYAVEVLHVPVLGTYEPGPEPPVQDSIWSPAHGLRAGDGDHEPRRAFPRWPVDLVPVSPGDPDPRDPGDGGGGRGASLHAEYARGYDLADPAYRPFDWESTLAMFEMALGVARDRSKPVPEGNPNNLPEDLLAASGRAGEAWRTALPRVEALTDRARALAASEPFSEELLAPLMAELQSIEWIHIRRPTAAEFHETRVPLTRHDADTSLWVHRFESLRFDWAKHAYAADPASLPTAVREHYEGLWRSVAVGDMPSMGHVPIGYVHEFDPQQDHTLIELPSSSLMSWMFGDVDHLVLTMRRADLAAGAWDAVKVQWSN